MNECPECGLTLSQVGTRNSYYCYNCCIYLLDIQKFEQKKYSDDQHKTYINCEKCNAMLIETPITKCQLCFNDISDTNIKQRKCVKCEWKENHDNMAAITCYQCQQDHDQAQEFDINDYTKESALNVRDRKQRTVYFAKETKVHFYDETKHEMDTKMDIDGNEEEEKKYMYLKSLQARIAELYNDEFEGAKRFETNNHIDIKCLSKTEQETIIKIIRILGEMKLLNVDYYNDYCEQNYWISVLINTGHHYYSNENVQELDQTAMKLSELEYKIMKLFKTGFEIIQHNMELGTFNKIINLLKDMKKINIEYYIDFCRVNKLPITEIENLMDKINNPSSNNNTETNVSRNYSPQRLITSDSLQAQNGYNNGNSMDEDFEISRTSFRLPSCESCSRSMCLQIAGDESTMFYRCHSDQCRSPWIQQNERYWDCEQCSNKLCKSCAGETRKSRITSNQSGTIRASFDDHLVNQKSGDNIEYSRSIINNGLDDGNDHDHDMQIAMKMSYLQERITELYKIKLQITNSFEIKNHTDFKLQSKKEQATIMELVDMLNNMKRLNVVYYNSYCKENMHEIWVKSIQMKSRNML